MHTTAQLASSTDLMVCYGASDVISATYSENAVQNLINNVCKYDKSYSDSWNSSLSSSVSSLSSFVRCRLRFLHLLAAGLSSDKSHKPVMLAMSLPERRGALATHSNTVYVVLQTH